MDRRLQSGRKGKSFFVRVDCNLTRSNRISHWPAAVFSISLQPRLRASYSSCCSAESIGSTFFEFNVSSKNHETSRNLPAERVRYNHCLRVWTLSSSDRSQRLTNLRRSEPLFRAVAKQAAQHICSSKGTSCLLIH